MRNGHRFWWFDNCCVVRIVGSLIFYNSCVVRIIGSFIFDNSCVVRVVGSLIFWSTTSNLTRSPLSSSEISVVSSSFSSLLLPSSLHFKCHHHCSPAVAVSLPSPLHFKFWPVVAFIAIALLKHISHSLSVALPLPYHSFTSSCHHCHRLPVVALLKHPLPLHFLRLRSLSSVYR